MTLKSISYLTSLTVIACSPISINADDISTARKQRLLTISQTVSEQIPLVIAHRGASGYVPEHTLEAAAFAHALGADYIEQDVVLSKDGAAIVVHDVTLNHVSDVEEKFPGRAVDGKYYVWDFNLEELRKLKITERRSAKFGRRFPMESGSFQIATLEEHLTLIRGLNHSRNRDAGVYVEIKKPAEHRRHGLDPSSVVLRILKDFGYENADDRAFVQCFEEAEVVRLRTELNCRLPLIQLASKMPSAERIKEIAKVADGLGLSVNAILQPTEDGSSAKATNAVKMAHEHVLMVHAWTLRTDALPGYCESSDDLINLLVREAGVDGIFADQPDVVTEWRTKLQNEIPKRGPFHLLRDHSQE